MSTMRLPSLTELELGALAVGALALVWLLRGVAKVAAHPLDALGDAAAAVNDAVNQATAPSLTSPAAGVAAEVGGDPFGLNSGSGYPDA